MQLVAIQIADEMRRIEHRLRPARRGGVDLAQRVAAILQVGSDHDRDVMIGQRHRQFDFGNDIQRHQLDCGLLQQELDRRVAADVGRSRQRQNAQPRFRRRTRRTEQPMRRKDIMLDRKTGLLVAQQLRDQRQIEPLARLDGAVDQLGDQLLPQRAKTDPCHCHFREPGHGRSRSAQSGRATPTDASAAASHAASVVSAGAANCDETSPWKTDRADMIEAALDIGPDFTADIAPAFAERKILAEISAGCRIDHAFEQCKAVGTSCQRIVRMLAEELQRCVGGATHIFSNT